MVNDNFILFNPGDIIFKQGEHGSLMYVLIEGSVEIRHRLNNGEVVSFYLNRPNDFFGEMALLDNKPRYASAIALTGTKVFAVDGPTFESMIIANGKFALKIVKILAGRIRTSDNQLSESQSGSDFEI